MAHSGALEEKRKIEEEGRSGRRGEEHRNKKEQKKEEVVRAREGEFESTTFQLFTIQLFKQATRGQCCATLP